MDFTFYDNYGDMFDWVSFDRNEDPEKLERANQKIKKYDNFTVSAFTTFNDIIRVHVVVKDKSTEDEVIFEA